MKWFWLIMTLASLKNFIDHKMEHYGYDDVAHQCYNGFVCV